MKTPTIEDIGVTLDEMPMHEMVSEYDVKGWLDDHYDAVVFALKLAKVVMGRPSAEAVQNGACYISGDYNSKVERQYDAEKVFKAMIEAAIKEAQDE